MSRLPDLTLEALCAGIDVDPKIVRFSHVPGGEVIFGEGTIRQVGERARSLGGTRVLLVSDAGIAKVGHSDRAVALLEAEGLKTTVYAEVHENPTTEDVNRCLAVAKAAAIDLIVGLGGGSSMDTAKGVNFLYTNGGEMKDYWGVGKADAPMLPFIAIPTTSGTGSECQSFALIADATSHAKMACGDKKSAASLAILDPELTVTQPRSVTAHTGIDAITHALETAVCNKRTDVSEAYSALGWSLLENGFARVLEEPKDLKARARMQLGAAYAGTAIENSMLGVAHSCANPLTAHYGIVHGQAVGIMMPHVIRWNRQSPEADEIYNRLFPSGLEDRVTQFLELAGMKTHLTDLGVETEKIPQMAKEAAAQWTAQFNPVSLTELDFEAVYNAAL